MIENISSGIWMVGGGSGTGVAPVCSDENDCNVYLIATGDSVLLIDSGSRAGRPLIEENIRQTGFQPEQITDLLLSHSHYDHTETALEWQSLYDPGIHMSAVAAEYLDKGDHRLVGYQIVGPEYAFELFRVDHSIEDGEVFNIGIFDIEAYAMPGHTPDSMIFETNVEGQRVWICGDITFGKDTTGEFGCIGWLNMLWQSNLEVYRASLERMLGMVQPNFLLPGHGNIVSGEENIRQTVQASLATVAELMDNPHRRHFGL